MTRIQTACCCLAASAFVLAALVMVQASHFADNKAQAEMVVNKDTFTLMSAQFRTDSEIIYVLDSRNERLLAYLLDPNQRVIKLLPNGALPLPRAFEQYVRAGTGPSPQRRSR